MEIEVLEEGKKVKKPVDFAPSIQELDLAKFEPYVDENEILGYVVMRSNKMNPSYVFKSDNDPNIIFKTKKEALDIRNTLQSKTPHFTTTWGVYEMKRIA
jgi:hypothetical protein